jgi:hypothetical protein
MGHYQHYGKGEVMCIKATISRKLATTNGRTDGETGKINGLRTAYRGELKKHVIERKLVLAQMTFMYLACGILMAWISSDTTKFRWQGNAPP